MDESSGSCLTFQADSADLQSLLAGNAEEASVACEQLRRALSEAPEQVDVQSAARAVLGALERHNTSLRVAHLCVAVLAHPALNSAVVIPDLHPHIPILHALERLSMSAAFVHTALAALQNAASPRECARDSILQSVISAMQQHSSHTGILLRGADLIAFHLNQSVSMPSARTFENAANIVVSGSSKLAATPQGASAGLLALVAAAKHATSQHAQQLPGTSRFSRGVSGSLAQSLVDDAFAGTVVAAMTRHKEFAPVQVLACELIRVSAKGPALPAKGAAREYFAAGALNAIVLAMQVHRTDDKVIELALAAIRAILLLGEAGSHARSAKPTIVLSPHVSEPVITAAEEAATAMLHKNPTVAASAKVLAVDIRIAASADPAGARGSRDSRAFSVVAMGRRFARSLRMNRQQRHSTPASPGSSRHIFRPSSLADQGYASGHIGSAPGSYHYHHHHHHHGSRKFGHSSARDKRPHHHAHHHHHHHHSGAAHNKSFGHVPSTVPPTRRGAASPGSSSVMSNRSSIGQDPSGFGFSSRNKDAHRVTDRYDVSHGVDSASSMGNSADLRQQSVHQRWKSVGGRWYSRARRNASLGSPGASPPLRRGKKDRRGPLTLSGSEVANLTRQPSQAQFGYGMDIKPQPQQVERRKRPGIMPDSGA